MAKCIFYTYAYNAEKTLERAVGSVLAQEGDFVYYLMDNGSTDQKTGEMIQRLAAEDSRIIPLRNRQNQVWEPGVIWWEIARQHDPDDVLCFLDADDAYQPHFLKAMMTFLEEEQLDIAVCGSDWINAATGERIGARSRQSDLLIRGHGFSYYFPQYHQYMRTLWGKLYRMSLFQDMEYTHFLPFTYGSDTLITSEAFLRASRIGIKSGTLHEYYMSPTSVSYQSGEGRAEALEPLYNVPETLLEAKCGRITDRNRDFLTCVYLNDTKDALRIILKAEDPVGKKLDSLALIFGSRPMLLSLAAPSQKQGVMADEVRRLMPEILEFVRSWLLSLDEVPDEKVDVFCQVGECVCGALGDQAGEQFFRQLRK